MATGVQERDRKLIVGIGATVVVVDRTAGSVYRVRTIIGTSTELVQLRQHFFRLVTSSGNLLKIIITITEDRPRIQTTVIVPVPIQHFPAVGECSIHLMIFVFTTATSTAASGASVITSGSFEPTTPRKRTAIAAPGRGVSAWFG